ncbi:hypothetical protein ACWDRX_35605, partial [Streptomyces nigra]
MLYAGFMSAALPPFPQPEESLGAPPLLDVGTAPDEPCLRADAARNRARLLEAASRLIRSVHYQASPNGKALMVAVVHQD